MAARITEGLIGEPSVPTAGVVALFGTLMPPFAGPRFLVVGDPGAPIEAAVDLDASAISAGGFARIRVGDNGRDVIIGSFRSDLLVGRGGNDTLLGLAGDDVFV